MKQNPRFLFWIILSLTIVAILVDLPKEIPLSIHTKIPLINKTISFQKTVRVFNPNFYIGDFHFQKDFTFKKGLDLEGGTSITLKADMKGVPAASQKDALDSAESVIEKRVNLLGVSEPVIQTAQVNGE